MKARRLELAILLISIAAFLGFSPVFESIGSGIAQNAVAAGFSAMFVVLATKILLGHESELSQQQRENERIFEARHETYQKVTEALLKTLDSQNIGLDDVRMLRANLVRLSAVAPDEVMKSYWEIFDVVAKNLQEGGSFGEDKALDREAEDILLEAILSFVSQARIDLNLQGIQKDKTNLSSLFESTLSLAQDQIDLGTRKELAGGLNEWVISGGNNNQDTPQGRRALNEVENVASSLGLRTKYTKTTASIRNENASGRSKVVVHISRMSQNDLRIVLPSHLSEQKSQLIASIIRKTKFTLFEFSGGMAFNLPFDISEIERNAFKEILSVSSSSISS